MGRSKAGASPQLPAGWLAVLTGILLFYAVVLFTIRPETYSDTFNYAKHIVDQRYDPPKQPGNPFWNFGHVIWPVAGYAVWRPACGGLATLFGGDEIVAAGFVLVLLSVAGGMAGAVALFLLAARTTGSLPAAAIATMGYLSTNAVLHYQLTGMPYVFGMAFQVSGLCVLERAIAGRRFTLAGGAAAGLLFGLSILTWFPYVLSLPGFVCYAAIIDGDRLRSDLRERALLLAGLAGGVAVAVSTVYLWVMLAGDITSVEGLSRWVAASRYDKRPNRGVLRMLGSIPRGFVALGETSTAWKRLLFEHRIESVGAVAGLWKAALVYLVLVLSTAVMWGWSRGRRQLMCLLVTAAPLGVFAAFLFEATPPERYMGAFPLLFTAFASIMAHRVWGRTARFALAAFFGCALAVNVAALSRFREPAEFAKAQIGLEALNSRVTASDRILLSSYQDPHLLFVNARPFSPLSKNRFLFYVAAPWGTAHAGQWRRQVAERVRTAWKNGGRVWMSRRFLAAVPDPAWGWIENDDPRLRWADFHAFFKDLELGHPLGGADGFSEILRSRRNEILFESIR